MILGGLRPERVPLWAAHWLAAGRDGSRLVELAGLHGDDPREVRDLLPAALIECGVPATELDDTGESRLAAAKTIFAAAARRCLDGSVSERWVVEHVVEAAEPDFDLAITDLPLGSLYRLDDEWGESWGRPDEELRAVVRRACQEQLRAG